MLVESGEPYRGEYTVIVPSRGNYDLRDATWSWEGSL